MVDLGLPSGILWATRNIGASSPEDYGDYFAAANWGGGARTPSFNQALELVNSCTWQLTELNDVYGQLVTGPNGNSIFLPTAGGRLNLHQHH